MEVCQLCNRPIDPEAHDHCAATLRRSGVPELVIVHEHCINRHDHTMAREAFLSSGPAVRGGMTFKQWYGGKALGVGEATVRRDLRQDDAKDAPERRSEI